jgi:hypothetical protein
MWSLFSVLIFVTGCPTFLVGMPSFATTAVGKALEVRQEDEKVAKKHSNGAEEVATEDMIKKMVRREGRDEESIQMLSSVNNQEQMNTKLEELEEQIKQNLKKVEDKELLKHGGAPCTPGALAEAQMRMLKAQMLLSNPHGAATLPDSGAEDPTDPCTKLAKKLTPAVAFGHVVIKEPDGNVSQVPDRIEKDDGTFVEHMENTGMLWKFTMALFWLMVIFTLCGICFQNKKQNSKANAEAKKRSDEALVEGKEDIEQLIKEGASAGKIALATKKNEELKKKEDAEKLRASAQARSSPAAPSAP